MTTPVSDCNCYTVVSIGYGIGFGAVVVVALIGLCLYDKGQSDASPQPLRNTLSKYALSGACVGGTIVMISWIAQLSLLQSC